MVTDEARVSNFVSNFYSQLYSSSFKPQFADSFFERVQAFTPIISDGNRSSCEMDLTMEELDMITQKAPLNKSPGPDGLPFEFYRTFWQDIKKLVLEVFKDCINKGELTESMKQGLITLIPKPNKDSSYLDNWRPITLLNSDYKLLASLYANRLKPCLEEIVSVSQSGFMKGRHNNIRLVLDILDYNELINNGAIILFLDFYKAFDTVEHEFMFESLRKFGFGSSFIRIVQTFYKNINSNVSLVNGVSPQFTISRGIRQGCPF